MSVDWTDDDATIAAALRALGIETDLADASLASEARAAVGDIAKQTGIGATSIELYADGGSRFIPLDPPASSITTVTEDGTAVTAGEDGYRLRPGGVLLERLSGGSPSKWSGSIHVTYAGPASDDQYDRVVVDLVKLTLNYSGLDSQRDGDYAEEAKGARGGGGLNNYQTERELLISGLTAGVWLR